MKALRFRQRIIYTIPIFAVSTGLEFAERALDANENSSTAAVVPLLCPATLPCKLEIGRALGEPWIGAEAGEVNYFEVRRV